MFSFTSSTIKTMEKNTMMTWALDIMMTLKVMMETTTTMETTEKVNTTEKMVNTTKIIMIMEKTS